MSLNQNRKKEGVCFAGKKNEKVKEKETKK